MKHRGEIGAGALKIITIMVVIASIGIITYGQKTFNEKIAAAHRQEDMSVTESESICKGKEESYSNLHGNKP